MKVSVYIILAYGLYRIYVNMCTSASVSHVTDLEHELYLSVLEGVFLEKIGLRGVYLFTLALLSAGTHLDMKSVCKQNSPSSACS